MDSAAMETTQPELVFENVEDGETIHQRCLIIKARFCPAAEAPSVVTVEQRSEPFDALYPSQTWPVEDGNTKIVVMLSVGSNHLSILPNSDLTKAHRLRLTYTPDTRLPPLHLATGSTSATQAPSGAGHTAGIMKGDRTSHWPRHFVARTSPSTQTGEVGIVVDKDTINDAVFDIKDLLAFKRLPHFWMEGDDKVTGDPLATREAPPSLSFEYSSADEGGAQAIQALMVASPAKIVRVLWNGEPGAQGPSLARPFDGVRVPISDIEAEYSRDEPLRISFLGGNGKERVIHSLWELLEDPATLHIPGSEVVLHRRSVRCKDLEEGLNGLDGMTLWSWATLLSKPMQHGTIARASEINICVGDYLLGLYVRFQDGIRVNCGPRCEKKADGKYEKHFGGNREDCMIPPGYEILRVEVTRGSDALHGMRLHLSNGEVKGALSDGSLREDEQLCVLEPPSGERIVGFYGRNYFAEDLEGMVEFGIITAPGDVELPAQVYEMPQLQNTDGGLTEADYDRADDPHATVSDWSETSSKPPTVPQAPFDVDNSDDELMAGMAGWDDFTGLDLDG
ncbi:zinc metalloproteinase [Diaporthe helianthi]|uniref:Zinc metalloproteinase n=1 Tax=Diaporthe helianthi TaxID=158607 RepID=A0A2P5I6E0_DIAHE|nr:zinc metalloproteinase [Diaporthe helianthi]